MITAFLNLIMVVVCVNVAAWEEMEGSNGWAVFWLALGGLNAFFFFGWLL